ncbi:MAG: hypothetical protein E7579_11295, partial [Ruminococcaceae bacterium]|nr:hypothetical protein [Oscillospiraceae bacterium]
PERADYMDYIERALFNHILASRHPESTDTMHNGVTYMLPIGPGVEKQYTDDYYSFTCCHGTGMENHVKYGDCIYYLKDKTVYVNQYIPSKLGADDVFVNIDLPFPASCGKVTVSAHRDAVVKFRIPAWCKNNPFTVNGNPVEICGRYAVIECGYGETVTVDVCFDYAARWEFLPDSKTAALLYGPFVMVTCDPSEEFLHLSANAEFTASLENGKLTVTGAGRTFCPIYDVHDERYHTYFILE